MCVYVSVCVCVCVSVHSWILGVVYSMGLDTCIMTCTI